jgi:hypothetical protein
MMSMWSVSMAGHMAATHPVALLDVIDCVRLLWKYTPPRKPPDPIAKPLALYPSVDGEGREPAKTLSQLRAEDAGDFLGFDVLTGSTYCMPCDLRPIMWTTCWECSLERPVA